MELTIAAGSGRSWEGTLQEVVASTIEQMGLWHNAAATPVPKWDGAVGQMWLDASQPLLPADLKQQTVTTKTAITHTA